MSCFIINIHIFMTSRVWGASKAMRKNVRCQEISFVHFSFARSSPYNVRGSLFKDPFKATSGGLHGL